MSKNNNKQILSPSTRSINMAQEYVQALLSNPDEEKLESLLSEEMEAGYIRNGVVNKCNKKESLDRHKERIVPFRKRMEMITQNYLAISDYSVSVQLYSIQDYDIHGRKVQSKVSDNLKLRFVEKDGVLKINYVEHDFDPRTGITADKAEKMLSKQL